MVQKGALEEVALKYHKYVLVPLWGHHQISLPILNEFNQFSSPSNKS